MVLTVNGIDLYGLSAPGGVTVQANTVDGPDSGRTMDATMRRSIVAIKEKIIVKFPELSQENAQKVLTAVQTAFVSVTYDSPRLGRRDNVKFYAQVSALTATPPMQLPRGRGIAAWKGLELTLVER